MILTTKQHGNYPLAGQNTQNLSKAKIECQQFGQQNVSCVALRPKHEKRDRFATCFKEQVPFLGGWGWVLLDIYISRHFHTSIF